MAEIARHVRIAGHVQGVFFRAWTRERAGELGVAGWVRNCPDGSVEAHVEGEDAAIRQMIERLHQGPGSARVENVDSKEAEVQGFDRFDIRH